MSLKQAFWSATAVTAIIASICGAIVGAIALAVAEHWLLVPLPIFFLVWIIAFLEHL